MIVYVGYEYVCGGHVSHVQRVFSDKDAALAWIDAPERQDVREVAICEVDGGVIGYL